MQKSEFRSQKPGVRVERAKLFALILLLPVPCSLTPAFAQQPQAQSGQPILAANAKYVQGIGPGYWPTAGAGLTLNLAPGSSYCNTSIVTYAGGSLVLTGNATNYVYLDPAASCAPALNTAGFQIGQIPLAKVTTASGAITSIVDARNWFAPLPCTMNSSGATTCASQGTNQTLTLSPSGTGSTILNGKVGVTSSLYAGVNTIPYSATPVFDASLGNTQQMTLTGNVASSTLINATRGQYIYFDICQDTTGSRTFAWPANVKSGPVVSVLPSVCTHASFLFDGTSALATGPAVDDQGDVLLPNAVADAGVLLTPFHAFLDEGSGGMEIVTNNNTGAALVDPTTNSWDLCLSCGGGEFSVWYAPATSGPAPYTKMWSIDTAGAMRNVQSIYTPRMNNIRYADQFPGTDAGAQIAAAIADLPATGGTVDARGFAGAQTVSANFLSGLAKPVRILFGHATFTTVPLVFPAAGSSFPISLLGAGPANTIFVASAANQPVFRGPQSSGSCDQCAIGFLSVEANASGSTGPAIDTTGFRSSVFDTISYLSNGAGNFNSFFHFASSPTLDYGNKIEHPIVQSQTGPTTVFLFDNGGTSNPSNNSNVASIDNLWIYANTGIATVIDARRSAQVSVTNGDIECNTAATTSSYCANDTTVVAIPGAGFSLRGVWLEANATASIVGASGVDGSSNDVHILGNYISGPQTFTIQSGGNNWVIRDNVNTVPNLTVTDNSGGGTTNLVQVGATMTSSRPDTLLNMTNTSTGGGSWLLDSGGTTGAFSGGGFGIRDFTNSQNRMYFNPLGRATLISGSSTSPALTLAPSADSPGSLIVTGTNAAKSATNWGVTQAGQGQFLASTGTAPLSITSTTPVANLSLGGGAGTSVVSNRVSTPVNNLGTITTTQTLDASLGNTVKLTLGGNIGSGSTLTNAVAGQWLQFIICQDATGSRTFVWPSTVKGGMTVGTTASKCSAQAFIFDGTNAYALSPGVANM